jgi:hypothetical protein
MTQCQALLRARNKPNALFRLSEPSQYRGFDGPVIMYIPWLRVFVPISTRAKLLLRIAVLASITIFGAPLACGQSDFDLPATDVTIFAADSDRVIGHGHYKLSYGDGVEIVEGENKYLDGEYDREEQRVKPSEGGEPPLLVHYQHRFFNADGTTQYEDSLDARTGDAACTWYDSDGPDIHQTILKIPADTYAGATQLMLLVGRLRQGTPNITFHSFNCIPDPRIIPIKATPLSGPAPWPMYPGKLMKMEMTLDLGWLNILIAPFIPKLYGWFDPADAFNYVGGQFDRYYKGRHVLMVRTHDANPVVQGGVSQPPQR